MKKFAGILLLLCLTIGAFAQVVIKATTDKTALTLDDELTFTVKLSGVSGNISMPKLPSLPAFNVYSREVEQSNINGQGSVTFRYIMLPRFVGQTTIGPVTFNYQGNTYQTAPIDIRIYRNGSQAKNALPPTANQTNTAMGAQQPSSLQQPDPNLPPLEAALASKAYALGAQPFFMVAAVDNKRPYVNQEITLAVRFYYSKNFYDAPYQKPSVSNIFMEDGPSAEGTQVINGTLYRYQEQRYYLMGAAPGQAIIGPALITYHTGSSPLSAFDRLFGGSVISEEKKSSSEPITLQIQPLPSNKPESFYGAVGIGYSFKSTTEPSTVEAGEAINWTATVYGKTNLKPTQDLTFPNIEGFKNYPAASVSGVTQNTPELSYKTFKTILVPTASGIYTIPSLEWSYFNPISKKYHTLKTESISVTVTPSTKEASGFDFSASQTTGNGFQTLGHDVRYLKTTYAPTPSFLAKLSTWNILNGILLALVGFCVLFASFGRKSLAQKKIFLTAKSRLKKATAYTQVAETVSYYLQQKFNINTGSLPLKDMVHILSKKGVRRATAESFSLLWQRLDAARFAPSELGEQSTMDLAAQALDVLTLMEEETK